MEKDARKTRVVNCCKRFVAFLFSHVGLAAMVVSYSILGGFLFMALESPHELELKAKIGGKHEALMNKTLADLAKITFVPSSHSPNNPDANASVTDDRTRAILEEFERGLLGLLALKLNGTSSEAVVRILDEEDQWSFSGSLLFAVTVVTTIG